MKNSILAHFFKCMGVFIGKFFIFGLISFPLSIIMEFISYESVLIANTIYALIAVVFFTRHTYLKRMDDRYAEKLYVANITSDKFLIFSEIKKILVLKRMELLVETIVFSLLFIPLYISFSGVLNNNITWNVFWLLYVIICILFLIIDAFLWLFPHRKWHKFHFDLIKDREKNNG